MIVVKKNAPNPKIMTLKGSKTSLKLGYRTRTNSLH